MYRIIKKLFLIVDSKQKIQINLIGFMMLIGGLLETFSVSLVFPLVSVMMNPDIIHENELVGLICERLRIDTIEELSIFLIGMLILLFIIKAGFLLWEYYVQNRFACNNRYRIQKKLLTEYLKRPYEYFLDASSGEIVFLVNNVVPQAFRLLSSVLGMMTECVLSVMLIMTIVAIAPLIAMATALIILGVLAAIFLLIKPILHKAGIAQRENGTLANKWLLQITSGVKELKVSRKERYFIGRYACYGGKAIEAERKYLTLSNLPRLMIESSSISGMLLIVAILVMRGQAMESLVPQISAFAMAAVKLLPATNRISTALNELVYQESALDRLLEHLKVIESWEGESLCRKSQLEDKKDSTAREAAFQMNHAISIKDLTYCYPGAEKNVLESASMEIPVGKSIGIIGVSGAGKTTVVDILLGLLLPKGGRVLSDGVNVMEHYEQWLSRISYIPQMIFMLDDTIRANVAFGHDEKERDDPRVWHALEEAQMGDFVRGLRDGLDTEIGERGMRLSGGQRQRIGIARALYTNPELLVFDEATSALDNETEAAIMESINSLHGKKTMIIIAHRLGTIEECDLVYRVENGKIIRER